MGFSPKQTSNNVKNDLGAGNYSRFTTHLVAVVMQKPCDHFLS